MKELPYTVIRSRGQYDAYCKQLEALLSEGKAADREAADLLTVLIQDWDRRQHDEPSLDPVALLTSLLKEHGMKAAGLASLLDLSRSAISNILNRRRRLTAEHIRTLAMHFGIRQEALNRPYELQLDTASAVCEAPHEPITMTRKKKMATTKAEQREGPAKER